FQAEDGIRDRNVTGVQTCALPISRLAFKDVVGFQRHAPPLASDTGLHGLRLSSDGRSLRLGLALRQVLPFCHPGRLALLRTEVIDRKSVVYVNSGGLGATRISTRQ